MKAENPKSEVQVWRLGESQSMFYSGLQLMGGDPPTLWSWSSQTIYLLNWFNPRLLKRQWIQISSLETFGVKFHSFLQGSPTICRKTFGLTSKYMFLPLCNALNSFFTHQNLLYSVNYLGPRILASKVLARATMDLLNVWSSSKCIYKKLIEFSRNTPCMFSPKVKAQKNDPMSLVLENVSWG